MIVTLLVRNILFPSDFHEREIICFRSDHWNFGTSVHGYPVRRSWGINIICGLRPERSIHRRYSEDPS